MQGCAMKSYVCFTLQIQYHHNADHPSAIDVDDDVSSVFVSGAVPSMVRAQ